MHTITAKVKNIVQAENRGTVLLQVVTGKEKAPGTQIAVNFSDPEEAAKYKTGKEYTIEIKPRK